MPKVCIDAGHFGKYNRSDVHPSYYESDMTWKLQNSLKKELEAYNIRVITTRDNKDVDLPLHERGMKSQGCDLFISLHSNACNTESVDRAVVITYQDVDWTDIDDVSKTLAEKLGECIKDTMLLSGYQVYQKKSDNDRDGNGKLDDEYYGVLYGARRVGTPGIIVEHGFHTNLKCARWLSVDSNLEELAKAEAKVIAEFFGLKKNEEWYADAQRWAVENGIADGTRPNEPATRAEVWTMLQRLANKTEVK